ncbi:BA75_02749T0 [Komagataella pastoris]|uniref:BA75_02749T0 n=1 Tax=Komagataella pastoris TaxID=4922 RepID=A0A1B2JA72_PICPA|nr:BA75_02749T0 [Komagataella pastoris]
MPEIINQAQNNMPYSYDSRGASQTHFQEASTTVNAQEVPPRPKNSYSVSEMFDIRQRMVDANQLLPVESQLPYRVSEINRTTHVDLKEARLQDSTKQSSPIVNGLSNKDHDSQLLVEKMERLSASDQTSNWSSPLVNHPLLTRQASGRISSNMTPPPGIAPLGSVPPTLEPSQIQWIYLDAQGQEQGPFDGLMMQGWFEANYLTPELRLRRKEESNFRTLAELVQSLGDFRCPFLKRLPPITQSTDPIFFANHAEVPQWGANASNSKSNSPWISHQNLSIDYGGQRLNSPSTFLPQFDLTSQIRAATPLSAPIVSTPDFSAEILGTSTAPLADSNQAELNAALTKEAEPENIDDFPIKTISFDDEPSQAPTVSSAREEPEPSKPATISSVFASSSVAVPASAPAPVPAPTMVKNLPSLREIQQEELAKAKLRRQAEEARLQESLRLQRLKEQEKSKSEVSTSQKASDIAPWANTKVSGPAVSLREIQALEAKQLQERKKKQLNTLQTQPIAQRLSEGAAPTSLPASATWAKTPVAPVLATKSLTEIQKEQAEAQAQRLQSQALKNNVVSFANVASSSSTPAEPEDGWTVISKKVVAKPKPSTATVSGALAPKQPLAPSALRALSAQGTVGTTTSSTRSSQSAPPSRQFLDWCRSQLVQLNKSVNKEDLLSILLQLSGGSESQEIIADTIYSNSSIMDGRRFASEFLKRKQVVEAWIEKNGFEFDWYEAQTKTLNDTDDSSKEQDDEWDTAFTKVVSKKPKKRV